MEDVALDTKQFAVKTEVFEGPLELLLELVEKRKLLINDINLAEVTDEYMQLVAERQEASLPHTAQFVALAATLLLIKSKSLLPVLELTREEEATIDDLEERLKLYKIYRDAARGISERFGKAIMHERQFVENTEPIFTTDQYTELSVLGEAMYSVINNLPQPTIRPKVQVKKVISLDEMTERLQSRIERQMKLTFQELVAGEGERATVIVGFLAILESVKQGNILVAQATRFSDIEIERERASAPKYY